MVICQLVFHLSNIFIKDCIDTDNGKVDRYGYGCSHYTQTTDCGKYDYSFDSFEMCCICGGGSTSMTSMNN